MKRFYLYALIVFLLHILPFFLHLTSLYNQHGLFCLIFTNVRQDTLSAYFLLRLSVILSHFFAWQRLLSMGLSDEKIQNPYSVTQH